MDGTGVPVIKKETERRKGEDQRPAGAHTRSQTRLRVYSDHVGPEGYAIRDPDSTTYCGAIKTAEEFGKLIYHDAGLSSLAV